jgi:hypothetical protein
MKASTSVFEFSRLLLVARSGSGNVVGNSDWSFRRHQLIIGKTSSISLGVVESILGIISFYKGSNGSVALDLKAGLQSPSASCQVYSLATSL